MTVTPPMRVLVVIDSLGLGGAENLLAVLGGSAHRAGLQFHVASLTPASMGRLALVPVLEDAGLSASFLDVSRLAQPSAIWRIAREIRSRRADVVHAHLGYSAILAPVAARLTGRPAVATLHHVPEDLSRRERLKERMSVESPGRLGRLVFVSEASRRAFASRYPEKPSWQTIHNGVNIDRFSTEPAPMPAEFGIPTTAPVVTVVAALRRPKGHRVAIEAWPRVLQAHPEARLLFVGDGDERESLKDLADRSGVAAHVVMPGLRSDVPEILRASTLVALPSFTEALPTSLIEAAASGRPVVATSVGGTAEVVEHATTGLLVPPGDPQAFSGAVTSLLSDSTRRATMGRAARRMAEQRFDADVWAHKLRSLYDAVVGRGSSWPP